MKILFTAFFVTALWAVASLAMPSASEVSGLAPNPAILPLNQQALLDEFRRYYRRLETATHELVGGAGADSVVLERLGDQLDLYRQILNEVWIARFPDDFYTYRTSMPPSSHTANILLFAKTPP